MSLGDSWGGDAGLGGPPSGSLLLTPFMPHQKPFALKINEYGSKLNQKSLLPCR